ncbi:SDR family NAD(P)-dependent oxidoreductase [Verminephrobacter eiseniae]|uniref:SDR family NAD(P)-dependent oxidoreductase n=1 Tax=Verminephrobacter eiseniae TaxID=364317 RepID=UPI0022379E2E|nr:SDR family NAD(P)-dependent oxidoreductase [Verminephrobacter eiseniae]MCW5230353.1 SDR family oxidoreductase [Verminephrobacter eiseniae]MCW5292086.1 SDR family oxidoreductase [Verminephrobacter eiseniae]MCW8185366.1 SDR family oxidoreductase [Verminephrobacter eiseniae]MCW8223983.1 SDR family oxidoreductase [Verminephrobacter eiseniae]MCW8233560.1 SDR family oxidoreductase [Verminephrobacter eiseniae]
MKPVAIVTGGSSNIGWACVQRFCADHRVLIADLQPPQAPLPEGVSFIQTDITSQAQCAALIQRAATQGALAALVHSAAITAEAKPFDQIDAAEWRRLLEVNLTGSFLIAQSAIALLRRSRGAMVLVSSRAARTGYAALTASGSGTKPHYCASKAGVLSLVKSLAVELAGDGVRVNAVVPGAIEGAMIPQQRWAELSARIPLGRLGLAAEVADAAHYLCSSGARYVTGHALDINGGTWMN